MHKDDDFRIVDSIFVSKLFDIHMQCILKVHVWVKIQEAN